MSGPHSIWTMLFKGYYLSFPMDERGTPEINMWSKNLAKHQGLVLVQANSGSLIKCSLASSSARSPPSTLPFLPGWGVGGSGGVFQFFQFCVCIVGPSCCGAPMGLCGLLVVRVWT